MRKHTPRIYQLPPAVVTGYELDPDEPGWLSVILAKGATNIVANPSVELAMTGYTAVGGSIARVATEQHNGAWSLQVTPGVGTTDGVFYGNVALVAGSTWWSSVWYKGTAGLKYTIQVLTTGGVGLSNLGRFTATGRWQRVAVPYAETASNNRRIYIRKDNSANVTPFYIDGLQCEANLLTTYLDGDMVGLLRNRTDFYWIAAPHLSSSVRIEQCRAGGILMPLKQLGFHLLAIIGLSMAPVRDSVNSMARGGAVYQDTTLDARPFTLVGYIEGEDPQDVGRYREALLEALDPFSATPTQPVTLRYQLSDCGAPIGDAVNILCNYQDGLRGQVDNNHQERLGLQFNMYLPLLIGVGTQGANLGYQTTIANANYALARINGDWQALGTGFDGTVNVVRADRGAGRVYFGGAFGTANGVARPGITYWDVATQAFVTMGGGAGPGGDVLKAVTDIQIAPNHDVYVSGSFVTVDGATACKGFARWNYATNTWTAFNPTVTGFVIVQQMVIDKNGKVYLGGSFTDWNTIPAADRFVSYTPSTGAYAAEGAGFNGGVTALGLGVDGLTVYVGGVFTAAGAVPTSFFVRYLNGVYNATGFGGGNASYSIDVNKATGEVAVGGTFNTGRFKWLDITDYYAMNWDYLNNAINAIVVLTKWKPGSQELWFGGAFAAGMGTLIDQVGIWSGNAILPIGVNLPGAPQVNGVDFILDDVYLGYSTAGSALVPNASTTVTNKGSAESYPRFTITGPGSLISIRNVTTGKTLYFNLDINAGETVVLDITQARITLVSSFRGNILGSILQGSNEADFVLRRGANLLKVAMSGTFTAATDVIVTWLPAYNGLDGVVPRRILP